VEAILEADPYLTGPSPKDISGQLCKGKHKSMRRSAINALNAMKYLTGKLLPLH